jgi:hypothetical protein
MSIIKKGNVKPLNENIGPTRGKVIKTVGPKPSTETQTIKIPSGQDPILKNISKK